MPVAIIAEISATPRIIRPKALHAVGHCIPRRRPVVAGRGVIRTGAVIVGSRKHSAYDRITEKSCTHTPPGAIPSSVEDHGTASAPGRRWRVTILDLD